MELRKPKSSDYRAALDAADLFYEAWKPLFNDLPIYTARIDVDLFAFDWDGKPNQTLTVYDTEGDVRTRLSNMMTIGRFFGVTKWKRIFSEYNGTFSYIANAETTNDKIFLKYVNAAQGKCTIIKTTEMVEKVTYKADCKDQVDAEISASEGMVE
jgi:hypothetical protein